MMGPLTIELETSGNRPRWRMTTVPSGDVARLVVGRSAQDAAQLIPRVFNLCASAHTEAAHAALGLPLSDPARHTAGARQERLRDHAVAILCDWPSILGLPPDRAGLNGLSLASEQTLQALHLRLLGREIDLATGTAGALDHWLRAGESATARLLAHIRAQIEPGWGRAELPTPQPDDITAALAAGTPTAPRETTAMDLWRGAPLLRELLAREGASLFVRMLARLVDLLGCLGGAPPHETPARPEPGIGLARAARGLLAHRARTVGGIITEYRVLSPSAWNLAADGLLARMLAALPMNAQTPMLARLAVSCVNPCVPVTLPFGADMEAGHA